MKNSTVTLKAVAEQAGCSINAASTVLNGARGKTGVSDETRERLIETAAEMGYRPNLMARAFQSNRSRQVGVLVRNNSRVAPEESLAHPLAYEFVLGISEGLEGAGYMMSFVRLSDVDPRQHLQASAFQGHLLDGVIAVNALPAVSAERLESLVPHCVWLDGNVWNAHNCVRRDEFGAGQTVGRELAAASYRQWIVLRHADVGAPHYSAPQRTAGIEAAARETGAQVSEWVLPWQAAPDFTELWARLTPDLAVIGLEPYSVMELGYALTQTALRPGTDFGLASCDEGFHGAGPAWSQLARVSFNRFAMGRRAARMMIHQLDESNDGEAMPSELIRGEWMAGPTIRSHL